MQLKAILYLILFIPFLCHAQSDKEQLTMWDYKDYISVTVSPSAIFNTFPGIQVGVERKIHDYLLEFEFAYISSELFGSVRSRTGYRNKLSLKYIFQTDPDPNRPRGSLNFIAFHRYTSTVIKEDHFLGTFFRQFSYDREQRVIGLAAGISSHTRIFNRFDFELGIAGGPGLINVHNNDDELPPNSFTEASDDRFAVYNQDGLYFYPILSFQLKLKYLIHHR